MSELQHLSERLHYAIHSAQCHVAISTRETLLEVYCHVPLLVPTHNEASCSSTDFLYKYLYPAFQWNSIVLSIYQVNSVDDLTCTALVMGWLGFPQLEPLPGSAANFKISNSSCLL